MSKELVFKIKMAVSEIEERMQVNVATLTFLEGELKEYISLLRRYVVPTLIELNFKDKTLADYCINEFLHADAEKDIRNFLVEKKEEKVVEELIKDILNSHTSFKRKYRLLSIETSNNYDDEKKLKKNIFFGLFGSLKKTQKNVDSEHTTLNQTVEITKYERSTNLNNELKNLKRNVFYDPFIKENKLLFASILEKDFAGGMFVLSRMAGLTLQVELMDEKINPLAHKIISDYLLINQNNAINLTKYFYLKLTVKDSNQINKINYKTIKGISEKLGISKNIEWNLKK